ncbi:MAG: hypothetical protein ACYC4T_11795, partial [Melioribacteraceae bacterium]
MSNIEKNFPDNSAKGLTGQGKTLWKRWQANAEKNPDREAIVHWVAGEEPIRWSYKNLIETAKK